MAKFKTVVVAVHGIQYPDTATPQTLAYLGYATPVGQIFNGYATPVGGGAAAASTSITNLWILGL
jgi:hypothetical protein